jgi:predicted O-linked N-acetylglucosamine transferase (SPINDLY family)
MESMTLQQAFERAVSHQRAGELAEAESLFRQLIALQPNNPSFYFALFTLLYQSGRLDEGVSTINHAIKLQPDEPLLLCTRGELLGRLRRLDEAKSDFGRALALQPNNAETWFRMANTLGHNGAPTGALTAYRRALALRPDYAEAWSNLTQLLIQLGDLDQAITLLRDALKRLPNNAILNRNLGLACRDAGYLDDAIAAYRHALAVRPDHHLHGDLLFTIHFHPEYDSQRLAAEHQAWYRLHAQALRPQEFGTHANEPSPGRRLRIGYVSDVLGDRPLGRFLLPLLANHESSQVEVFCYCNVRTGDAVEAKLMSCTTTWRLVSGISDRALAELIRSDQIDILVDLNLHTAGNRLLAFALKPAPVQVTYLAYPGTTGLPAIDYRFTDANLDPPGVDESGYTEKSVRLRSYWCYPTPPEAPPLGRLPAVSQGHVTFGCLNDYAKIGPAVRSLWAGLLRTVPNSRLLLHAKYGSHRKNAIEQFATEGIDPGRLEFVGRKPIADYVALYNRIDVALDPFPWNGGTTTCDALYMGVPVVSLVGEKAVSRGGLSILSNVGLSDLVATNSENYLRLARCLAEDRPRLEELRHSLRQRMLSSPLMDGPAFARDVETAYRSMWHEWCRQQSSAAL